MDFECWKTLVGSTKVILKIKSFLRKDFRRCRLIFLQIFTFHRWDFDILTYLYPQADFTYKTLKFSKLKLTRNA